MARPSGSRSCAPGGVGPPTVHGNLSRRAGPGLELEYAAYFGYGRRVHSRFGWALRTTRPDTAAAPVAAQGRAVQENSVVVVWWHVVWVALHTRGKCGLWWDIAVEVWVGAPHGRKDHEDSGGRVNLDGWWPTPGSTSTAQLWEPSKKPEIARMLPGACFWLAARFAIPIASSWALGRLPTT